MSDRQPSGEGRTRATVLDNPRWVNALFGSTNWAWLWLMVRVWLGVRWVEAGWHKTREEAWTGGGMAVKGFWERVVAIPEQGRPPIAYDWYREFLEFLLRNELHGVFGVLIAYGEVLVGVAFIVGAFSGIAAFGGVLMNWSFMLAGTASANPVLGIVGLAVMVAWKTAGWWGADRIILPCVGAPWSRGALFGGGRLSVEGGTDAGTGWQVEQWARMLVATAIAVAALGGLDGVLQIGAFALATLLAALTGTGVRFFAKR